MSHFMGRRSLYVLGFSAILGLASPGGSWAQDDGRPPAAPGCTEVTISMSQGVELSPDGTIKGTNSSTISIRTDTSATPGGLFGRFLDWLFGGGGGDNNNGGGGGSGGDNNNNGGDGGGKGGGNNNGGDAGGSDGGNTGGSDGGSKGGDGGNAGDTGGGGSSGGSGASSTNKAAKTIAAIKDMRILSRDFDAKSQTMRIKFDPSHTHITKMNFNGVYPLSLKETKSLNLQGRWGIAPGSHESTRSTLKIKLVKLPSKADATKGTVKKGAAPGARAKSSPKAQLRNKSSR